MEMDGGEGGKRRRIMSSRGWSGMGMGGEVVPRPGRRKRVGSRLFGRFSRFFFFSSRSVVSLSSEIHILRTIVCIVVSHTRTVNSLLSQWNPVGT
jgi:hypothetical protein